PCCNRLRKYQPQGVGAKRIGWQCAPWPVFCFVLVPLREAGANGGSPLPRHTLAAGTDRRIAGVLPTLPRVRPDVVRTGNRCRWVRGSPECLRYLSKSTGVPESLLLQ